MVEIPFHLPTPVSGWVRRSIFEGRSQRPDEPTGVMGIYGRSQRETDAVQFLLKVEPEVASSTSVFESRFHLSREEQRRLTDDTLAYNAIKDTLETMTDRDEHARVMGIYDRLMERYADPSLREETVPDEAY